MKKVCFSIIFLAAIQWSEISQADIYKYTDERGIVFYSDKPKNPRYKLIIRTKKKRGSLKAIIANQKKYAGFVKAAATKHGVDADLLDAVIRVESAYNPNAVSSKGAVGLMQLMPETAKRYGVKNRRDPEENIHGGADYLSDLLDLFKSDIKLALAAYNAGEGAVQNYGNQIPPYRETQKYVSRVLSFYSSDD